VASVTTEDVSAPLRAVARLAVLAGDLEVGGDPLGARRRRVAARRLTAKAVLTAASVNGAFGDRPGLAAARGRVLSDLVERARLAQASPARALGAVADAALELPALDEADWPLGAIAFVDEDLLRALYDACVELAAVALREAAG
jgi:hypothetical protein